MKFSSITRRDILMATREIDRSGVPPRRASYRYFLYIGGKQYPPKYVIEIAGRRSKGRSFSYESFNAVEAKNYLIHRRFQILEKTSVGEKFIGQSVLEENEETAFAEGKTRYRMHRTLERDSRVAKRAKELRLQKQGELRCEVCDFCFADMYGSIGSGFIEAHHIVPVSEMGENAQTALGDIAIVCANCHEMLHRTKPWLSITALREIVTKNSK